jgi:hypothetical protein
MYAFYCLALLVSLALALWPDAVRAQSLDGTEHHRTCRAGGWNARDYVCVFTRSCRPTIAADSGKGQLIP